LNYSDLIRGFIVKCSFSVESLLWYNQKEIYLYYIDKIFMIKKILLFFLPCIILLNLSVATAIKPHIFGPYMKIVDRNIIVNVSLANVSELETAINSGVGKEITFTVELLRAWPLWPDEFVASKKIKKAIKYDNLRGQYLATSFDGFSKTERQFKDYYQVRNWIFTENDIKLANTRELEPDKYYIRIIVESKSLKQLPVIGLLMHLVPEVDMTIVKETSDFYIGDDK